MLLFPGSERNARPHRDCPGGVWPSARGQPGNTHHAAEGEFDLAYLATRGNCLAVMDRVAAPRSSCISGKRKNNRKQCLYEEENCHLAPGVFCDDRLAQRLPPGDADA